MIKRWVTIPRMLHPRKGRVVETVEDMLVSVNIRSRRGELAHTCTKKSCKMKLEILGQMRQEARSFEEKLCIIIEKPY